ncbi:MobA/MobL family protein, partial [Escherichia coli]|nr:MobA/MobL family protein [Escherichia coli]
GINRTPEVHLGPVQAASLNGEQIVAIQERRNAERELKTARDAANAIQQEQEQKQKIKAVEPVRSACSPELLLQYRKVMKTVIQGEERLARLGDANPNALKEHKLLQNAKAKNESLSEWSRRIHEGTRYLDKLGRDVISAQRELRELQEQRNALNGIRGLFRGADKREIDARILEQESVLETAEREENEFRYKLQQAESEWKEKYAAFQRTEGYKYVDPTGLDKYREREILAAVSLENTRQKVAEEISVARSQMLSLEPELNMSGDEKAQMRHELLAEMALEQQQQEEKALRIQQTWVREASRSNERDQDMER